jgi:hypothetical protein
MGKSYLYECSRCGYRARVSGQADRGTDVFVETIHCAECRMIVDVVTRLRVAGPKAAFRTLWRALSAPPLRNLPLPPTRPPSIEAALSRLPVTNLVGYHWIKFEVQCPKSPRHKVRTWNDPDICPRCGAYLQRNVLPYRLWD